MQEQKGAGRQRGGIRNTIDAGRRQGEGKKKEIKKGEVLIKS